MEKTTNQVMTNNVKRTERTVKEVVEPTGKEFSARNNEQSPHKIGAITLTDQESTLLRGKPKITDYKPRKMDKRDIENRETNCSAKPTGLSSKTQKLGKRRIKYKTLCDTTETPGKLSILISAPKTNVQDVHTYPCKISADKTMQEPELFNSSTVMNKKALDKSSVEAIAPVVTSKKVQTITASGRPLAITSTVTDVKLEQSSSTPKNSKNLRKKIAKRRSSVVDVLLVECIDEINVSRRNDTMYSAKPEGLNPKTQNSRKKRIKYTKLYEITELPGEPSTFKTKINIEETHINHGRKSIESIDTKVFDQKAVEESTVQPLAPVDKPKEEPFTINEKLLKKTAPATEINTKQSGHTEKTSKKQRENISKMCPRDVIAKKSLNVKYVSREKKTNISDKLKGVNSMTQQSGKKRLKYTKLYEITEIPGEPSIQTYVDRSKKKNIEKTHINHGRNSVVPIDVAIDTCT